MSQYSNLLTTINANIKANGNEEITGPVMNDVLRQTVADFEQVHIPTDWTWAIGSISTVDGTVMASTIRARSPYIHADSEMVVATPSAYKCTLLWYDELLNYLSYSASSTLHDFADIMPAGTAYVRIVGGYADDSTVSDATDISGVVRICRSGSQLLSRNVDLTDDLATIRCLKVQYSITGTSRYLEARVDDPNFGYMAAGPATWCGTSWIYLHGAKYVRAYRNFSSASAQAANSGVVFYDKDRLPMTEGVRTVFYGDGGNAFSGWDLFPVPEGAMYMRMGVSKSVADLGRGVELYALSTAEIAGANPPGYTSKRYMGEKVDFSQNGYTLRQIRRLSYGYQSGACYGDYAVFVKESFSTIRFFNMKKFQVDLETTTGFPTEQILHCNQSQFGRTKYDPDDYFPLFYTSTWMDANNRCEIRAYRLETTFTGDVITAVTVTLVQTIYLPAKTDDNALAYADPAFDYDYGYLWTYSFNNRNGADNRYLARFTRFSMPAVFDGDGNVIPTVTLEDTDILDAFTVPIYQQYAQGGFISHGKLYYGIGGDTWGFTEIRGIDLYASRQMVTRFDLMADGVSLEPEALYLYDGKMWMLAFEGMICRFDIN